MKNKKYQKADIGLMKPRNDIIIGFIKFFNQRDHLFNLFKVNLLLKIILREK